jgi:hypothetical protein
MERDIQSRKAQQPTSCFSSDYNATEGVPTPEQPCRTIEITVRYSTPNRARRDGLSIQGHRVHHIDTEASLLTKAA